MEFSKLQQDKLIGTHDNTATLYDVTTGQTVLTLKDENRSNNYLWNRATLNSSDDLALNDGVLWDVNSGKIVHKFDKFNANVSGVFHPNGLEIIINSEVVSLSKSVSVAAATYGVCLSEIYRVYFVGNLWRLLGWCVHNELSQ